MIPKAPQIDQHAATAAAWAFLRDGDRTDAARVEDAIRAYLWAVDMGDTPWCRLDVYEALGGDAA